MNRAIKRVIISYQPLSNVGCEIIVRGTVAFLTKAFPDYELRFILPSYHVARDQAILADLPNVDVVPMLAWKRVMRGMLRAAGLFIRYWTPRFASRHFRDVDLFLSVGGDIYTMSGDQLPDDRIGYEVFATRYGIPSIMIGANMERFENLSKIDRATLLDHLQRFRLITVRDHVTADYLCRYGITKNVTIFPDPIFSLRPTTIFESKVIKRIGINFTPFLIRNFGEKIIEIYAEIISSLIKQNYAISLIPHVYDSERHPGIDDRCALSRLHSTLAWEDRSKVRLYDGPISFSTITEELKKVDLFVGGRMHGCLNSLTLGRSVCFLAYSKKAVTIVEWLRNESPFSVMHQSFDVVWADQLSSNFIFKLITAHNDWAEHATSSVIIDTESMLDVYPVWERISKEMNGEFRAPVDTNLLG